MKEFINKVNEKITEYGLRNILIILTITFVGLITYGTNRKVSGYDCSSKSETVAKMILTCEQQRISERIKEQELDLERYKQDQEYELQELRETLSKLKNPEEFLNQSKLKMTALKQKLISEESCAKSMIESMCPLVIK